MTSNLSIGSAQVSDFFQQLSEDTLLLDKLAGISNIEEDEYRGLAILSRTLFLISVGIKDRKDQKIRRSALQSKELSHIKSVICSTCLKNTEKNYLNTKENKSPRKHAQSSEFISNQPCSPQTERRMLREIKISNGDYRCLSQSHKENSPKTSPKANPSSKKSESPGKLPAKSGPSSDTSPQAIKYQSPDAAAAASLPSPSKVILAPATQVVVQPVVLQPVNGRTSVPETMAICDPDDGADNNGTYRDTDFFNDSKDVFDDSFCEDDPITSSNNPHATQLVDLTHISPVLGKGSGGRDPPYNEKVRTLKHQGSNDSSGTSHSQLIQPQSITTKDLISKCGFIPNNMANVESPIVTKVVNITISPKCQSDINTPSPSLLQIVPRRKYISQPSGSQILLEKKLLAKSTFKNRMITFDLPTSLGSPDCPHDVATDKKASPKHGNGQGIQVTTISSDSAPSTACADVKSKENVPMEDNKCSIVNSAAISSTAQSPEKDITSSILQVNVLLKKAHEHTLKKTEESPKNKTKEVHDAGPLISSTNRTAAGSSRSNTNSSTTLRKVATSIVGDTNCRKATAVRRHQSISNITTGSKLHSGHRAEPVAATIKKNYKQSKLTADSFIVSTIKGNIIEKPDPQLAEALAESLQSKQKDDRRRLQLQHPALRQQEDISLQNKNSTLISGGKKRKSDENLRKDQKRACVAASSSESVLTESQLMGVINESTPQEAGISEDKCYATRQHHNNKRTPIKQRTTDEDGKNSKKKVQQEEPDSRRLAKSKAKNKVIQQLNDSFDRIPRTSASPQYAHATVVERNRAKRRQLPGWSCKSCKDYYEGRDLTEEELTAYMNRCSKHRSKHQPITNTPEHFWNLDISSSDSFDAPV